MAAQASDPGNPGLRGRLIGYLADVTFARGVLWCYLLWYLVVVGRHFDASPGLWLTSLGLSVIIGYALLLNAGFRLGQRLDRAARWQAFRFFLMPFCVSSFAAVVKGRGFVLVFSPDWREVALPALVCGLFLGALAAANRMQRRHRARDLAAGLASLQL